MSDPRQLIRDSIALAPATEPRMRGSPPDSGKVTIELRVGELFRETDELEAALIAKGGLYQRGGLIVSPGVARSPTWDGKTVDTHVIEECGEYGLLEKAEAAATFIRATPSGAPQSRARRRSGPRPCPAVLIRTLRDRRHRLAFPPLTGVVNCPSIAADGELLEQPGYDRRTGVVYDPRGAIFPPISPLPSRREAERALASLAGPLETFDFVSDDDRSVGLSLFDQWDCSHRSAVFPSARL